MLTKEWNKNVNQRVEQECTPKSGTRMLTKEWNKNVNQRVEQECTPKSGTRMYTKMWTVIKYLISCAYKMYIY